MKNIKRKLQRQRRIRAKTKGTSDKPRLTVFRSNRFVNAALIDDEKGITIVSVSEKTLEKVGEKITKTEKAKKIGIGIAKKALENKIKKVVFDKGSYRYHGRVKAVADGAREGGLDF